MRKYILIVILLLSINMFSQEKIKLTHSITLIESVENKFPKDPILFYFGGNPEFRSYFDELSKKLSKKLNRHNSDNSHEFILDLNINNDSGISSFDDISVSFNNSNYNSICMFYLGKDRIISVKDQTLAYDKFVPTGGNESKPPRNIPIKIGYELFVKVIESKTNKIMLLKRFEIECKNYLKESVNHLSKTIIKELQLQD